jgi:peptidoglycan/LPS O-acetylase OafA/YrhL
MGLIRLILALCVVLSHLPCRFKMVGGPYAVEAFYIFSGFYMSLILSDKYLKKPLKLFYSNRLLKLFPIYVTVLIITIIISAIYGTITTDYSIGNLNLYFEYFPELDLTAKLYIFFVNFFLVLQDTAMFMGIDWGNANSLIFSSNFFKTSSPHLYEFLLVPQAWSIGVEITFYLIAPILVRKLNNITLVWLAFSSFTLKYLLNTKFGLNHDPWTYRFFPTEFGFFILGILSYSIYRSDLFCRTYLKVNSNVTKYALLFVILSFQFIATGLNMITKVGHQESRSIVSIVFFALICLLIPFIFESTKACKLDNRIGLLSYPVYISHILIIEFCSKFCSNNYLIFTSLVLTIGVSYLLDKFIQTRVNLFRHKRITKY